MSDVIKVRWHHMLCFLTHSGNGYSDSFKENMGRVIERLNNGAAIRLVGGADDICAGFSEADKQVCRHALACDKDKSLHRLDRIAAREICRHLQMPLPRSEWQLTPNEVGWLRRQFARGTIRGACVQCRWNKACTETARDKEFAGVKLMPYALPKPYPFTL